MVLNRFPGLNNGGTFYLSSDNFFGFSLGDPFTLI